MAISLSDGTRMHRSPLRTVLAELRRRRVFGVAVGYALLAWGIIQVTGTVLQLADAPPWIGKAVLSVTALGFPIALVLAWLFDLSPAGVTRTPPETATSPPRPAAARVAAVTLAALFVVALGAAALWLRPAAGELEFTQLTNFADAATAPALSADGRALAFLGGTGFFGNSAAPSQVYIKQLPDGEAVRLTNTPRGKASPAFSPDGTRVTFTSEEGNFDWSTHVVSVNGGDETELLPNASGLIWLDRQHVLYSEIRQGVHMGLRRSTLSREDVRDVYWPTGQTGMAHRSAVSPDRRWVLTAEMDAGVWQPCRIVPLDGSSAGRLVGPLGAQCTYSAWSPEGRWMYFSSNAGGAFHIWRQRFPRGDPEQLTHGPTEEEGIAVSPDGRSLITSAGVRHNSIWVIGADGEREVSIEEYAFSPIASADGRRVYFLSRIGTAQHEYAIGYLIAASLDTGAREPLLPDHPMVHFDLSADDRLIAFVSGSTARAYQGIWVAPLDRSAAPRHVFTGETERALFDPDGNIYFLAREGQVRYLQRLLAPDYTTIERISPRPAMYLVSMSPDGEWAVVVSPTPDGGGGQQVAVSTRGRPPRLICAFCGGGAGPARVGAPPISWTRDGRALLVVARFASLPAAAGPGSAVVVPVRPGAALPDLPASGIRSLEDYLTLPGARTVPRGDVFPGATADQLFFYQATTIRNLYRVRLPR